MEGLDHYGMTCDTLSDITAGAKESQFRLLHCIRMTDVPDDPADTDPTPARRRRRRAVFIAAAISVGLIPIILLELGLRAAGVGNDTSHQDPLVGFSSVSPLFDLDEDDGVYRTARSRRVLFGQQEFTAVKPADAFRVFCLGGSTVRGRPYTTETSFVRWTQLELSARKSAQTFEVVNCGGLSYASYRLTQILQEVLAYEPDLIVIATGHNEFLEDRTYSQLKTRSPSRAWMEDRLHRLRLVRLVREWTVGSPGRTAEDDARPILPDLVETRLDEVSGYASYHRDDDWTDDVYAHFDLSLRTMVEMCRAADVPVVLVLLGANVRDCPPFKSEHRPDLEVDDERRWQSSFAAAEREADAADALTHYETAAEIDDEHALLRFRIARLFDQSGRPKEAREHYLAAKDFDVCPLRMPEPFADVVRAVASETQTPLVNAREILETQSLDRIPGNDWYMDHVHPCIGAHQLIGKALVAGLVEHGIVTDMIAMDDESRRQVYENHLSSLGPAYLAEGYERVNWLERWARRQRLLDETLPTDAEGKLRYGHRLWDFDLRDDAWNYYDDALEMRPALAGRLIDRGRLLIDQGRGPEALLLADLLANVEDLTIDDELQELRRLGSDDDE